MSEQNTLRDTLEKAIEQHTETSEVTQVAEAQQEVVQETQAEAEQRARDEKGRFAAKTANQPAEPIAQVIEPQVERPQRPTSWKKDYWEHWDKIDPKLAGYLVQREQEFANGVSTYKNEWERAKPLIEAVAPFQPLLQQHNINPATWIHNLGTAHQKLALGSPQEKLQMFAQLAQDYGVNLQALMQGDQYNGPQTIPTQFDIQKAVTEQLQTVQAQQALAEFERNKEQYPHYDQVKPTMARLLEAGLANDLPDAYEKAVRTDNTLFQSLQEQKLKDEIEKRTKQAQQAKAQAVSPRSTTPVVTDGNAANKSRRSQIAEAFDDAEARI